MMRTRHLFLKYVWLIAMYLFCWSTPSRAMVQPLTLSLHEASLPDAIRLLAKMMRINVMISQSVSGATTLELNQAETFKAFDLLLASHGLSKWRYGNVWYIAPQDELIKRKQDEMKWQTLTEEASPLESAFWQIHYGKAEELSALLLSGGASLLTKRGSVRVDARTNVLSVRDVPANIAMVRELIQRVDVPVKQIEIEARLASVDHDKEQSLGISFGVQANETRESVGTAVAALERGRYSIAVATLADGSLLDVKLAALENAGQAELISTPRLFAANQQPAFIEAGEEVPYQEVSESGGTAVTFKKAVLGLKVTPQVLPGNQVLLQLQINQDRPSNRMVQGVPTISTRQMVTSVLVPDGKTIVLGGIYETNKESGEWRVPFLSAIPVLGILFKQRVSRENKRELLIFVTPKVVTQTS